MATSHSRVAVLTTATRLDTPPSAVPDMWPGEVVQVQNPSASTASVFLGTASVTTAAYGFELAPGATVSFRLAPEDDLYAVAVAAGTTVNVLRTQA